MGDAFVYGLWLPFAVYTPLKCLKTYSHTGLQGLGEILSPNVLPNQEKTSYDEVLNENRGQTMLDYAITEMGKYRCRDCGRVFDTLEAHDRHQRSSHLYAETYPVQGMTL